MYAKNRRSTTQTVAFVVAAISMLVVVPFGLYHATTAGDATLDAQLEALKELSKGQTDLLDKLLTLQGRISAAQNALDQAVSDAEAQIKLENEKAAKNNDEEDVDDDDNGDEKNANKASHAKNKKNLDARLSTLLADVDDSSKDEVGKYRAALLTKVEAVKSDMKESLNKLRSDLDARRNRFIVKWHGDDGVKTSERMSSEQKALERFETVGEFAKKLLMFDGSRWVVLREYGGQNWLEYIHNDGEVQDGDGKPPAKADEKKGKDEE